MSGRPRTRCARSSRARHAAQRPPWSRAGYPPAHQQSACLSAVGQRHNNAATASRPIPIVELGGRVTHESRATPRRPVAPHQQLRPVARPALGVRVHELAQRAEARGHRHGDVLAAAGHGHEHRSEDLAWRLAPSPAAAAAAPLLHPRKPRQVRTLRSVRAVRRLKAGGRAQAGVTAASEGGKRRRNDAPSLQLLRPPPIRPPPGSRQESQRGS